MIDLGHFLFVSCLSICSFGDEKVFRILLLFLERFLVSIMAKYSPLLLGSYAILHIHHFLLSYVSTNSPLSFISYAFLHIHHFPSHPTLFFIFTTSYLTFLHIHHFLIYPPLSYKTPTFLHINLLLLLTPKHSKSKPPLSFSFISPSCLLDSSTCSFLIIIFIHHLIDNRQNI